MVDSANYTVFHPLGSHLGRAPLKTAYFYGVAPLSPGTIITITKANDYPEFILISEMLVGGTIFRGPDQVPTGALLRPSVILARKYRLVSVIVDFTGEKAKTKFEIDEQES